jgi:polyhydroxybutyrate depolymerase
MPAITALSLCETPDTLNILRNRSQEANVQLSHHCKSVFAACIALGITAGEPSPAAAGTLQLQSITVGGVARNYYISLPPGFTNTKRYSLMFVLHGGTESGATSATKSQMQAQADRLGFIAVFPNTEGKEWNDGRQATSQNGKDVAFIAAIIDSLVQQKIVWRPRVFVAGISSGGMMAQRLACDTSLFAGVAAVVANMPLDYVSRCKPPKLNTPISFFLGTADPMMPYNGGKIPSGPNRGAGGYVISAAKTVQSWTSFNGCEGEQTLGLPNRADDGTTVIRHTFTGCRTGADVMFYEVTNGGHCWPGIGDSSTFLGKCTKDINATEEIVHFFQAYGL